jgi:GTP-binding protein HflX
MDDVLELSSSLIKEKVAKEKVIAVGVVTRGLSKAEVEMHLDELERLVDTAGGEVVGRELRVRSSIDPATFIGEGAVEELSAAASALGADVVIFDDDLSPGQVKNLEKTLPRVTDRAGLILEIFSLHARSREARTQVELARYEYLLPRLTGKYRGLSRLGGGIGGRGAGEQQLELDRRKIRHRISLLKKDLAKIETSRRVQKRGRRHAFQIAIAGYTNAGKTTLFNRLTEGSELAADRLFATLDARVGKLRGSDALVIDTVGLIRKLPPGLVASFRSTLSEIRDADLVIHAVDGSSESADEEKQIAEKTFADLNVDPTKVLTVYTKADLGRPRGAGIAVSSLTGQGLDSLLAEVDRRSRPDELEMAVRIPYSDSREIARARERARVISESDEGDALVLHLSGPRRCLTSLAPYEIHR